MADGLLSIGSRQPVSDTPAWVTLEVAHGGFATGQFLAAGPLSGFERKRLRSLGGEGTDTPRLILNHSFLSERGFRELLEWLDSGCFRITVPEQAALLVVACLTTMEREQGARELLAEIEPWMNQLRFYPEPAEKPIVLGETVHLESVGEVADRLKRIEDRDRILTQNEALKVWVPMHDEFVSLVVESCAQPQAADSPGEPFAQCDGQWLRRASDLLRDYGETRRVHHRCSKPERSGEVFFELRRLVRKRLDLPDDTAMSTADVRRTGELLRRDFAKRGSLTSEKRSVLRKSQARDGNLPTNAQAAKVACGRLAALEQDAGMSDPESTLQAELSDVERAQVFGDSELASIEFAFPASIRRKVMRCLEASVSELVEKGLVPSGDVLARLVPQIAGCSLSNRFDDHRVRRLFAQTYRAFRARRSLLLLYLQKQVQFEELPWVSGLIQTASSDADAQLIARQTFAQVAVLNLSAFPHAIVPNKLLQELRSLAKAGGLSLSLLDELAADIFMGKFSRKFGDATRLACQQLDGTLYAKYYEIDTGRLSRFTFGSGHVAEGLGELCANRAGVARDRWSVAVNGCIIEQQQILTTQNLATLFSLDEVAAALRPKLRHMSESCFSWLTSELAAGRPDRHSQLIAVKNAAYAWRQMLFFLSHLPDGERGDFIDWAEGAMNKFRPEFRERFRPALIGLRNVNEGREVDANLGQPLIGWTVKKHWMLT